MDCNIANNLNVSSLLDTTAKFIGENSKLIDDGLSGLPFQVFDYIVPYLSAASLHRLSEPLKVSGVSVNSFWKLHLQRRWSRIRPIMNIFHEPEMNSEYHNIYLMKHFFDLLKYCSMSDSTDPHAVFHTPLHKLQKPWTISGSRESVDYGNELMKYSHYADSLKLLGNQCLYICSNRDLLNNMCQTVVRLQLLMVIDSNYEYVRVLLLKLLQFGKLKQGIFSSVKLSYNNFKDLMNICSGLHEDKANPGNHLGDVDECEILVDSADNTASSSGDIVTSVHQGNPSEQTSDYRSHNCNTSASQSSSTEADFDLFDEAIAPDSDSCYLGSENRCVPESENQCLCEPTVNENMSCDDCDFDYDDLQVSTYHTQGLEGFALFSTNGIKIGIILESVLPKWKSLRKIGILFNAQIGSDVLMNQLVDKVRCHQLSHLVLDDVSVHEDMFEMLLKALVTNYKYDNPQSKPLELFDYQAATQNILVKSSTHPTAPLSGIVRIDLSMNTFEESGFDALLHLVKWDRALKQLKISGCYLHEHQVISLLHVLTDNPQIEMLGLSGNLVQSDTAEDALIRFLTGVATIQKLALNNCRLRSSFICGTRFVKALINHPALKELSLRSNHLESKSTMFLQELFLGSPNLTLRALDIGYNWIKGQDLVCLAETLRGYSLRSEIGSLPVLDYLDISGNRFTRGLQQQVRQMFQGLVHQLEADIVDLTQPHAEHASQM